MMRTATESSQHPQPVPSIKEIFTIEHVPNAVHWKEALSSDPALHSRIKPIADKITYEDAATIILYIRHYWHTQGCYAQSPEYFV